jgi:endonuclease G
MVAIAKKKPVRAPRATLRAIGNGDAVEAVLGSGSPKRKPDTGPAARFAPPPPFRGEPDAVEKDAQRAAMIAEAIGEASAKPRLRAATAEPAERLRMETRKRLLHAEDKFALERIIGTRDILQITFLQQALAAARPVCRLRVRSEIPGPPGFGTGFLVAPGVLLTNHHVLDSDETANLSLAEFDAELDLNYVHRSPRVFNLLPAKLFVTDADHDFTFVAVNSIAHDGTPLSDFRWLTLLRESGKAVNGEWATIIQHPGGESKQIVIRDNRIVVLPQHYSDSIGPAFVHYMSDTEPGSSGSPVLNDQLDVIALHHKAVPEYDALGRPLAFDNDTGGKIPWTPEMGESRRAWIANEGVRISAIFRRLDQLAHRDAGAAKLLSLLEDGLPRSVFSALSPSPAASPQEVEEGAELEAKALARRKGKGYDARFLGFDVPLPKPSKSLEKEIAPLNEDAQPRSNRRGELVYTHFSVVMHGKRRLAIFSAVNIDGTKLGTPSVKPRWRAESRISKAAQSLNELYSGNELDKGHLVRRLDPVWGNTQQEVDDAVTDTYHYTNAAPQEHSFNDGLWGDVEDYILGIAEASGHRISVFTGPVFGEGDLEYRANKPGGPWLIPARFWKVIAYKKADGTKAATGFVLDQSDEIVDLDERLTPLPKAREVARVHQRSVEDIEALTDLDFGPLAKFDPLNKLEATMRTRRIVMPAQILL